MTAPARAVRELDGTGPQIRLLYCFACSTIEELPDYEGRPDDDVLLQITLERHQTQGQPHTGHMFKVAVKLWADETIRRKIVSQVREGSGGLSEIDPDYYTTRSTFAEDAMTCYGAHLRPQDGCPDYMSDAKRLLPATAVERRELGMPAPAQVGGPRVTLCQFCPVHSTVMQRERAKNGLYA